MTFFLSLKQVKMALMGILVSAFILGSFGCGQKGPLYLPESKVPSAEKSEQEKDKKSQNNTY